MVANSKGSNIKEKSFHACSYVFAHEVEAGREVRVHEFEEEVSERPDLCPTGHVDTLGTQRHHEGEVGAGEGEDGQREHLLDTERERGGGG